jgi:hypothetical protein
MYQVDGFSFDSRKRAQRAKKEKDSVAYIRKQTSLKNPDTVLKLYNTLLDEEYFETEVGISFLRELQTRLRLSGGIDTDTLRPIPCVKAADEDTSFPDTKHSGLDSGRSAAANFADASSSKSNPQNSNSAKSGTKSGTKAVVSKRAFQTALVFDIILAACVAGMFVITALSGNNKNILNYKNEVINEYEAWQTELNNRQAELEEWEAELELREQQIPSAQE